MDPYFFEFVVGPPVEYLCQKLDAETEERVKPPQPKPKSRTMWDLPDPHVPKKDAG